MLFVGIDWSEKSHRLVVLDGDGQQLESSRIESRTCYRLRMSSMGATKTPAPCEPYQKHRAKRHDKR